MITCRSSLPQPQIWWVVHLQEVIHATRNRSSTTSRDDGLTWFNMTARAWKYDGWKLEDHFPCGMFFFRGYVKLPGSRWWFLLFLTYVCLNYSRHGKRIHFDYTIFFRWVGSTTNYIHHPLISFHSRNIWTQKISPKRSLALVSGRRRIVGLGTCLVERSLP